MPSEFDSKFQLTIEMLHLSEATSTLTESITEKGFNAWTTFIKFTRALITCIQRGRHRRLLLFFLLLLDCHQVIGSHPRQSNLLFLCRGYLIFTNRKRTAYSCFYEAVSVGQLLALLTVFPKTDEMSWFVIDKLILI